MKSINRTALGRPSAGCAGLLALACPQPRLDPRVAAAVRPEQLVAVAAGQTRVASAPHRLRTRLTSLREPDLGWS
jgi:hypothetical protein